jgi:hypothetical protein
MGESFSSSVAGNEGDHGIDFEGRLSPVIFLVKGRTANMSRPHKIGFF